MKKIPFTLSMLALIFTVQQICAQDLNEILNQIGGAGGKANYESAYKFDTYMQMEISDPDNQKVTYNAYLTRDGSNYAVTFTDGGANSIIIFDTENSTMLILSADGGEKPGFAMGIDPEAFSQMITEESEEDEKLNYEHFKTGKSKTILGYVCDEYLIQDDKSEVHIWSSEKLGKEVEMEIFNNQQIFSGAFLYAANVNGMPLEYTFKDGNSGEESVMKVTKIDLNTNKTISTAEYAVMTMGQ